jgi:hypothetical protein
MPSGVEEDLAIQAAVEDLEGVVEGVGRELQSHSLVVLEGEAEPEN